MGSFLETYIDPKTVLTVVRLRKLGRRLSIMQGWTNVFPRSFRHDFTNGIYFSPFFVGKRYKT